MKKTPLIYNDNIVGYVDSIDINDNIINEIKIYLFSSNFFDEIIYNINTSQELKINNHYYNFILDNDFLIIKNK